MACDLHHESRALVTGNECSWPWQEFLVFNEFIVFNSIANRYWEHSDKVGMSLNILGFEPGRKRAYEGFKNSDGPKDWFEPFEHNLLNDNSSKLSLFIIIRLINQWTGLREGGKLKREVKDEKVDWRRKVRFPWPSSSNFHFIIIGFMFNPSIPFRSHIKEGRGPKIFIPSHFHSFLSNLRERRLTETNGWERRTRSRTACRSNVMKQKHNKCLPSYI